MNDTQEQPVLSFLQYPPLGPEDWRYVYAVARVRVLETQMLSRAAFLDMANAETYEDAIEVLNSTDYGLGQSSNISEVEKVLLEKRTDARELFKELVVERDICQLLCARVDFANMRLALRRKLTDKPLGADYNNDGSILAEDFERIFEEEDYTPLPLHMQEAIESAVLAYYQNKNVRDIDLAIDTSHAQYRISKAEEIGNVFCRELFRMRTDLTNIRTMLRLKFTESDKTETLQEGGYVGVDTLKHAMNLGYDSIAGLFFATPYYDVVESGAAYLAGNNSFVRLEANCDNHLNGFLELTKQITSGVQPVIGYLLLKEYEIRTIRLILTAKRNGLDKRLILNRLGE